MKKNLNRFIKNLLFGCFLFCIEISFPFYSNASNLNTDLQSIIEEERTMRKGDEEFIKEALEKNITFDELVYQKAMDTYITHQYLKKLSRVSFDTSVSTMDMGNNGNNLSTNIPLIQQLESYTCGPTSALQVIYGMNMQNTVKGSSNEEKLLELKNECLTTDNTIVYNLTNAINNHTPSGRKYGYYLGSNMTMSYFQSKVETSLYYNMAPILHAITTDIPYYNGHYSRHYIAICEVDKKNSKMRVRDCNYNNKYYGEHVESISVFYNAINKYDSRYLICMN